jgi:hypothetical protein
LGVAVYKRVQLIREQSQGVGERESLLMGHDEENVLIESLD